MPTIKLNKFRARQFGNVPYGNLAILSETLATSATGAAINANSTAPIANGDKVVLGALPAGMTLTDFQARVSTAFTASVVANVGFEYQDGVDSATVPQDASYFASGLTLHTTGTYRLANAKAPVVLPKPAFLVLTLGGANNAKAARVDVSVIGEMAGG